MSSRTTVTINGIEITFDEQPDKPLILLLRMASPEMGIWDSVWDDFAKHFTVASFAFGQLSASRETEQPDRLFHGLAQAVADVARGLGYERFHVFGWNGGTLVALACAMDHVDRVQSCILLDPFYRLDDMRPIDKAVEFKRVLYEADRELYAYYWVMAGLTSEFIEKRFDVVEEWVARRMANDRFVHTEPTRFIAWVKALRGHRFRDADYARIKAPTLILATEWDRWNAGPSVAMAREVQKRIGPARLEVIENAGGHFLLESPERFMQSAEAFIHKNAKPIPSRKNP